ncbi:MAG TPA: TolC family protein, partial [Candidatus Polarisedimenticolia bacterium]|nr:TolC family protein [Candidatus Polarisedimenticolia bacterium]
LEEAERRAIAASPLIRAAGERVHFEEGRLRQAGIYPNPDLSLETFRFTSGFDPKETVLSLRQPIPYHGKRALEKKESSERVEVARRDLTRERLDLLLAVRESFYRIYYDGRIVGVEDEDVEATRALHRAAEARVAAGDAAPLEALKASVEERRAANELGRARGELLAEIASFNLLLGLPADAPTTVAEPEPVPEPADPLPVLQERALKNQPAIAAREHAALAAGFAAARARLERRPDVALGPTFGDDAGNLYAGVGVSLRLPLWNRNQGNLEAAEAARAGAVDEVDAARLAVARLVAESLGRYRSAWAQQTLFEQGLLAETAQLLESARKSYEGGESGILELLDARRTAIAVREEYYRASLDAALAAVALRRALGDDAGGAP